MEPRRWYLPPFAKTVRNGCVKCTIPKDSVKVSPNTGRQPKAKLQYYHKTKQCELGVQERLHSRLAVCQIVLIPLIRLTAN